MLHVRVCIKITIYIIYINIIYQRNYITTKPSIGEGKIPLNKTHTYIKSINQSTMKKIIKGCSSPRLPSVFLSWAQWSEPPAHTWESPSVQNGIRRWMVSLIAINFGNIEKARYCQVLLPLFCVKSRSPCEVPSSDSSLDFCTRTYTWTFSNILVKGSIKVKQRKNPLQSSTCTGFITPTRAVPPNWPPLSRPFRHIQVTHPLHESTCTVTWQQRTLSSPVNSSIAAGQQEWLNRWSIHKSNSFGCCGIIQCVRLSIVSSFSIIF